MVGAVRWEMQSTRGVYASTSGQARENAETTALVVCPSFVVRHNLFKLVCLRMTARGRSPVRWCVLRRIVGIWVRGSEGKQTCQPQLVQ